MNVYANNAGNIITACTKLKNTGIMAADIGTNTGTMMMTAVGNLKKLWGKGL